MREIVRLKTARLLGKWTTSEIYKVTRKIFRDIWGRNLVTDSGKVLV